MLPNQAEAFIEEDLSEVPGDLEGTGWTDDDRPEDERLEEQRELLIQSLAVDARAKVKEAVDARNSSGVERRWDEDRANHYGSDFDLGEMDTIIERVQSTDNKDEKRTKSRIGVNITRPKVNAAAARLIDMMFPSDERNWKLAPTPNPKLSSMTESQIQIVNNGVPMQNADGTPVTAGQLAKQVIAKAAEAAQLMQREIDDQLVECDFVGESRKAIFDKTLLGTSIVCGPVPHRVEKKAWVFDPDMGDWAMKVESKLVPYSRRVNPLDAFPDPAGMGDIKKCRYFVERFYYNTKTLNDLKGDPGVNDEAINRAIKDGPSTMVSGNDPHARRFLDGDYEIDHKNLYEAFLVTGQFETEKMVACGCEIPEEMLKKTFLSGCVLLVNDEPVKVYLNPLDSGDLPYDMDHYERVDGQPWGIGVAFIVRNPQRVVRAAWRMLMDNAANNIGGQIIMDRTAVVPANGQWKMTGGKIWWFTGGKTTGTQMRAQDVFGFFNPETRIIELLKVIEFALRFAEDETSMPAILEGSRGSAPDTVGGMQLLDGNANTILMRQVRQGEDLYIKPHLRRYYDYNMQYSDKPEIKGDFDVVPLSVSALRQKTIDLIGLQIAGQYVVHPQFGPFHRNRGYDWLRRFYSFNRINPDDILVDENEANAIIKQMSEAQPPPDPRIQVATMNADLKMQQLQAEMQDNEQEREHRKNDRMLDYQLQVLKYATQREISLEAAQKELQALMLKIESEERLQQSEIVVKAKMGSGL